MGIKTDKLAGVWKNGNGDMLFVDEIANDELHVKVSLRFHSLIKRLFMGNVIKCGVVGRVLDDDRVVIDDPHSKQAWFWLNPVGPDIPLLRFEKLILCGPDTIFDGWESVFGPIWIGKYPLFTRIS